MAVATVLSLLGLALVLWPGGGEPAAPPADDAREYSRIPRIDVHVHVAPQLASEAVGMLRNHGVVMALNASGGTPGGGFAASERAADDTDGRLLPYCNISFAGVGRPGFEDDVREALAACEEGGAVGLKIYKSLGLGIALDDGSLLRVDDPRLDVVFETCGELGLPVLIHSGDPQAFFEPPTEDNERYEELEAHPAWSFHGERPNGRPWPSWEEVFEQFETRVMRHPETTFVGAHFGNAPEEPDRVASMLERHDHYYVDTAARVPEIGRHDPGRMRRLFERFSDRIFFGSDLAYTEAGLTLGSGGREHDPPERVPGFFQAHWRYFETKDEGFAHPTPIQGSWTIDGLGLPEPVLERLYWKNAAEVFDLELPGEGEGSRP